MKILPQPDGYEGYVVLVEPGDTAKPLKLTEFQGEWLDIIEKCEGVVLQGGLFHCVYLTNNSFGVELVIPDEPWLPKQLRLRLMEHLI